MHRLRAHHFDVSGEDGLVSSALLMVSSVTVSGPHAKFWPCHLCQTQDSSSILQYVRGGRVIRWKHKAERYEGKEIIQESAAGYAHREHVVSTVAACHAMSKLQAGERHT